MILTLTPNPSIDFTMALPEDLTRGAVHRVSTVSNVAGGKGINVAVATHRAQQPTMALFPAPTDDTFIRLISSTGLNFEHIHNEGAVRTNTTIMEIDGTTTKLNGPGAALSPHSRVRVEKRLADLAVDADWVVLAGSLPPEAPADWYTQLTAIVREANPKAQVAIDTSDAPLINVAQHLDTAAPDLMKPNGFELGVLAGIDGHMLEQQAAAGHYQAIISAAQVLCDRGVEYVLVTLGAAGAVLVHQDQAWAAKAPAIDVLSTVGAGDCSLAGFILGQTKNLGPAGALRLAVAYGTAATTLPGTQIPFPEIVHPDQVGIVAL
ncbi:1-phosphofructokinase family hexose kinase [Staphylococcus chromogenes]|nr:1-phosphofructokinase family hexose kinase [Staphylococcus chromogenes]